MYQYFTLIFTQSFIIKLQKAKYNKLLDVTKRGKVVKPGRPINKMIKAKSISAIIAINKFLPIGCL